MECSVCFDDVSPDTVIRCHRLCDEQQMCRVCFTRYIEVSCNEQTYPRCTCGGEFFFPMIQHLVGDDRTLQSQLESMLLEMISTGTVADSIEKRHAVMDAMTRDFTEYIARFPKAVSTCLRVCYPYINRDIQKRLLREQERGEQEDGTGAGGKYKLVSACTTGICNGTVVLDRDTQQMACNKCSQQYCTRCSEVIHPTRAHVCKKEDLAFQAMRKNFVPCPHCSVLIEKSHGCNFMRCTNCGTDFDWATGLRGGAGNDHNESLSVKQAVTRSIVQEFAAAVDRIGVRKEVYKLENTVRCIKDETKYELHLERLIQSNTTDHRRKMLRAYIRKALVAVLYPVGVTALTEVELLLKSNAPAEDVTRVVKATMDAFARYNRVRDYVW